MASTSGYDTAIRKSLVNKGVSNADIGFNPGTGYVTVKGRDAIKAPKVYNGTSFTTQQDFNTQYDTFNRAQQQPAQTGVQPTSFGQAPTGTRVGTGVGVQQPTPTYTPPQTGYNQQIQDIISQLSQQATAPQQFTDVRQSPEYAAFAAQSGRRQQEGIRAAQEALGSAGFGRSTTLGESAGRVAGQEQQFLESQVVPQLMAQQEAQRQQQFQNILQSLQPLLQQQQFAEQTAQSRAGLTGAFLPPEAQNTINQLLALKQQAEAPTITREARTGLSSQADVLRSQLAAMGVDPSVFGAGRTAAQATGAMPTAGIQTQAAQAQQFEQAATTRQLDRADFESDRQFEFAKGQQAWENNFQTGQFNWQKAQQAWENTFKEKDFQQSMRESAASRGLQWASLNQRQKESVADQAFREKQFQYEVEQDKLKQTGAGATGDYATDPSFAQDISWINQNPNAALAEIQSQSQALIAQYGYKGYQELLKAAGG